MLSSSPIYHLWPIYNPSTSVHAPHPDRRAPHQQAGQTYIQLLSADWAPIPTRVVPALLCSAQMIQAIIYQMPEYEAINQE